MAILFGLMTGLSLGLTGGGGATPNCEQACCLPLPVSPELRWVRGWRTSCLMPC